MKIEEFWKKLAGISLLVFLTYPMLNFANTNDDKPFIPPNLVKTETSAITKYADDLDKYVTDCQRLKNSARLAGEQLKKCLTTLKDLRTRFDGFLQMQSSLMDRIKRDNKWTKDLDDEFEKNAVKQGTSAELVADVKGKGGFRSYFQSVNRELKGSKTEFNDEIAELEEMIRKSAAERIGTVRASAASFLFVRKVFKLTKDSADSACTAVCCYSTSFPCAI